MEFEAVEGERGAQAAPVTSPDGAPEGGSRSRRGLPAEPVRLERRRVGPPRERDFRGRVSGIQLISQGTTGGARAHDPPQLWGRLQRTYEQRMAQTCPLIAGTTAPPQALASPGAS